MEHDTRRTGRSGRQNRLLIDLKVRSQTEIPPNVSMFGDDPAMYYLRDGRNAQRRSDLDRRISNEVELRRLHNVPAHLAESTQREMEGDRAGSHRIHSLITEGLTTSSHNLSVVSNTVGEKTAAASKVVKQFAKTSWKASKHQGRKVGDEIRSKTAPVIASVRHQLRSGSSSSDSHRTSPHTRVHILEAVPVAQHPAFLDGEKLAAVPGIHPPSYDRALFDPTEPPFYARPPLPPPTPTSFDDSDASGQYGEVLRSITYPDFNCDIYDIGGVMTHPPPPVPSRKHRQPGEDGLGCHLSLSPSCKSLSGRSRVESESVESSRHIEPGHAPEIVDSHSKSTSKIEISNPVALNNPFEPEAVASALSTIPYSRANTEAAYQHRQLPPIPTVPTKTRPTPPPRLSLLLQPSAPTIKTKEISSELHLCQTSTGPHLQFPQLLCNSHRGDVIEIEYDNDTDDVPPESSETECDQQMICDKIHESIDQIEQDLRQASLSDFDTEHTEMRRRTSNTIDNMNNEFMKRIQFPILADYEFNEPDHLNFKLDEFIIVKSYAELSNEPHRWLYGEHTITKERGIFPQEVATRIMFDENEERTTGWV